jgi:hypothetical protein
MERQAPVGGPLPADDDFDLDEHFAWLVREIDAGRVQAPPESAIEGPAISISLGDACDVDPALLAGMCGQEGLGAKRFPRLSARTRRPTCFVQDPYSRRSPPRRSPAPAP